MLWLRFVFTVIVTFAASAASPETGDIFREWKSLENEVRTLRDSLVTKDDETRSFVKSLFDAENSYRACDSFMASFEPKKAIGSAELSRKQIEQSRLTLSGALANLETIRRRFESERNALEGRRLSRRSYNPQLRSLINRYRAEYVQPMKPTLTQYDEYISRSREYFALAQTAAKLCNLGKLHSAENVKAIAARQNDPSTASLESLRSMLASYGQRAVALAIAVQELMRPEYRAKSH